MTLAAVGMMAGIGRAHGGEPAAHDAPAVYFTREITPQSLLDIYKALGVSPQGRVAVKISTGESEQTGYLRPAFLKPLIDETKGVIVECNTAYGGNRGTTERHLKAIAERGFTDIAEVDIMDAEGDMTIPVKDTRHLRYDIVGNHLANYDFMINLAHFKGHAMGGFGGVLKNASIGVASSRGKVYIHSAGASETSWGSPIQDDFLESMAASAQAVHDYMNAKSQNGEPRVVYINVMNNLSVDCDCDAHPDTPEMKDVGILASLDPVALDKACLDLVFNHQSTAGDDSTPLINRINRQHGTHIVEYAEQIGLGSQSYTLIELDTSGIDDTTTDTGTRRYNVFDCNRPLFSERLQPKWLILTARICGFKYIADPNTPPIPDANVPGCPIACLPLK